MSSIPFDTEGFVDMDHFDANDPDAVPALADLAPLDADPVLDDDAWGDALAEALDPAAVADDSLVGTDDGPFDVVDDAGDSPFDVEPEAGEAGEALTDDLGGDLSDELSDELSDDPADDATLDLADDGAADELVGADLADPSLADAGFDGHDDVLDTDFDLDTDAGVGIDDDLDAVETLDFD